MTNLDPKHLDALVAEFQTGRICAENGEKCRAMDEPSGCRCAMAADAITALRTQIDRERAATIEAAAQWHMDRIAEANRQIAENNEYLAREGLTHSEANERCRETVWNSRVAIRAIRAMHTDATRAAMDAIRREGYEAGVREEMAKSADLANAARDLADCCQLGDDADWTEGEDPLSALRAIIAARS